MVTKPPKVYDVIVVGSGASDGWVAMILCERNEPTLTIMALSTRAADCIASKCRGKHV